MSAGAEAGGEQEAPLYAEPVLGFRLWAARADALMGVTYEQLWKPGENVARCGSRPVRHEAPAPGCRCGFNALNQLAPEASLYGRRYVGGAIAAWGEIEMHATGFRAERACLIALCFEVPDDASRRRMIERIARAYRVQAVPRAQLAQHAAELARPLQGAPPVAAPRPRRRPAAKPRSSSSPGALRRVAGGRGHWIGRHVLADWWGGHVAIGAARGLSQRVDAGARVLTVAPGSSVAEGDAVAVLHTREGSFAVAAPVGGRVTEVNPEATEDPRLAAVSPSEGGWLVRLKPDGALLDECPLVWGRRGREQYDAFLARVGAERMLDDVRLSTHLAGTRLSRAEDAVSLMRERLRHQAARQARRLQAA